MFVEGLNCKNKYNSKFPLECIVLHQQIKQLKVENAQLKSEISHTIIVQCVRKHNNVIRIYVGGYG